MAVPERIERNVDLSYFEGQIPIGYIYTYGLGLEKFFRAIMEKDEFLASRCPSCGTTYFPCRVFCERCFSEIENTYKVSGAGTVVSYTICHLNMDGTKKENPEVVGLIEIDGVPDSRFVHILIADPAKVKVGMKVRPVLKPKRERKGGIYDIVGFKP